LLLLRPCLRRRYCKSRTEIARAALGVQCFRAYRYEGDDSLGNSIFTALEAFPVPETVERPYHDNLFVVLEIYLMKNGHFYIWPYVQSGATSDDCYTRQSFPFAGEFETRDEAIAAGWAAGKEVIDSVYCAILVSYK